MTLMPARRMDGIDRTLIRRIFDSAPPGSINLGLGQPDLPTPPRIAEAGIDGIRAGRTGYTTTAGDPKLRAAIAGRYPGVAADASNVVVTIGSQEAVFASVMALVDPGDEILVPDPGYPAYAVVARLLGAVPRAYPLRSARAFRIDPNDVSSALTERTRLVILCSPSNPTGAIDDPAELEALATLLAGRGIPWLSDEIYSGFAYDREATSISRFAPSSGVVVSGISKELSMTGWRIGWAVGPEPIVAKITVAHQYIVTCASSVSQAAALEALSDAARGESAAYLEIFRRRRALMADELRRIPSLPLTLPDGAFYFFVDVRGFGSSLAIAERLLLTHRVIVIPGEAFGPGGAGFLRLSYAAKDEDIRSGVRALGEVLAG